MGGIEIRTLSGSKIVLDDGRPYEGPVSDGDPELLDAVWRHVETNLAPVTALAYYGAEAVRVDLLWVAPSRERRFHTLVTCGMAERPMNPPELAADCRFAELVLCLPPEWPLSLAGDLPVEARWPIHLLGGIALYVHRNTTWLWYGHTITSPVEKGPFAADTLLANATLDHLRHFPDGFRILEMEPEREIQFFNLIPLYREEVGLAMWKGTGTLLRRLDRMGYAEVVDPKRPNVATEDPRRGRPMAPPAILPFPRRRS